MGHSSDLSFRFQGFWLTHKLQLKRVWVLVVIAVETLVFVFAGATLAVQLIDAGKVDRALALKLDALTPGVGFIAREPLAPTFGTPSIVTVSPGRVDIYVPVKNENARWDLRRLRY